MPKKSLETDLALQTGHSHYINYFLTGIYALAALAGAINSLPVWAKLAILAAVAVNYRLASRRWQRAPAKIRYTDSQKWQIELNGEYQSVQILPETVLTTLAIFLSFKYANKRYHWLIAKDCLSAADYRKLLVKLKITQSHR
ncbi:MAG: hypothetical protein CTY34_09665 [Methylobacter sp.]|nr:MAG: hypothetical protein CTY34_09665 [Methylobacter sp.]